MCPHKQRTCFCRCVVYVDTQPILRSESNQALSCLFLTHITISQKYTPKSVIK